MDQSNSIPNDVESRRDAISSGFEKLEEESKLTTSTPEEKIESHKIRDESGKFSKKEVSDKEVSEKNVQELFQEQPEVKPLNRPTHWKKDYLPIWDKFSNGQPLTAEESRKLAEYSLQRESEFASGVSTYRAEAEKAKELQNALAPFMADLQQHNINPAQWIGSLGNAHKTLTFGSPEQKMQMFAKLASDYGVDLNAFSGQSSPMTSHLMQQIQQLSGQVNTFASWREQEEHRQAQAALSMFNDADKYPHYEVVRGTMAELLLSGLAQDPKQAYDKAVRLNDEVWQAEQERQAQVRQSQELASKANAVAKAKSNAISVKTVTPSGSTNSKVQDRRSLIQEQISALGVGRL